MGAALKRLLRLSPKDAKAVESSQGAILRIERGALRSLRSASSVALESLLRSADGPDAATVRRAVLVALRWPAEQLRRDVTQAVLLARGSARGAAFERFAAQVDAAIGSVNMVGDDRAEDMARSETAGDSYASAWRATMTATAITWARQENPGSLGLAIRRASASQDYRLVRTAATEVPQAFGVETDNGAGWIAEQYKDREWLPLLVKRWDATLDKSCDRCRTLHGSYVPVGMQFSRGDIPGSVHAHCHCVPTIVILPMPMRGHVTPGRQADDERPREAA